MKRIMAYLRGGLGNQCFIYAAARAIMLRSGGELALDQGCFLEDKIYKRQFALSPFQCITQSPSTSIKPIRLFRKFRYALLCDRVSRIGNYVCDRRPCRFRPMPENWTGTLTLDGYFQSEKYFYGESREILSDFSLKNAAWLDADPMAQQIRETENSIFLHVRTYKEVPGKQDGECAIQLIRYYENAIAYLKGTFCNGKVFVFSDDIEWVAKNICAKIRGETVFPFVFNSANSSQLRDFSLMRLCKHGIVADSSFSWWAGWLGEQERLKVGEAPIRIRVNRRVLNDDFWPERWVRIDAQ